MASCLDPELWKVCAGSMVKVPVVNSIIMYFPQGHAEYAKGSVDFNDYPNLPPFVECRVDSIKCMADVEDDDIYLKMRLVPLKKEMGDGYFGFEKNDLVGDGVDKFSSFTKTLTQSDANNGGGFSVPKYLAESLFPMLDYSADPPVQNLHIKDVHGVYWKFRHIFRGTPRRHLLTTGWSSFVNDKKLVSGDSVIFMRAGNGELFIGIRRAKRDVYRVDKMEDGWTPSGGMQVSLYGSKGSQTSFDSPKRIGKVSAEKVLETARLAAAGKPFEVNYHPRAGFDEFCVKSSVVSASLRTKWCAGLKFRMNFGSEDASKANCLYGTVQAVESADPVRWSKSPWRMLKVTWDEPNSKRNVERVSPWSVDIEVGSMLNMHTVPFSPPIKRLRVDKPPKFHSCFQNPPPLFRQPLIPNISYYPVAENAATGIQGARHVQSGYPLNLNLKNALHPHLVPEFRQPFTSPLSAPVGVNICTHQRRTSPATLLKNEESGSTAFVLFGRRIVIEEKKLQRSSMSPVSHSNLLSDGNADNLKNSTDSSESVQNGNERSADSKSSSD